TICGVEGLLGAMTSRWRRRERTGSRNASGSLRKSRVEPGPASLTLAGRGAGPGRRASRRAHPESRWPLGSSKSWLIGLAAFVLSTGLAAVGGMLEGSPPPSGEGAEGKSLSRSAGELRPVPVPEASEKALQYYRSGNWLWAIGQAWAILLTGGLAFSG